MAQDYPKDEMEVFLVDGMSKDGTREIISQYTKNYQFFKLLDNPQKFTPFALNIGIKQAKGEYVIRMDAHAEYQSDYISKCVKYSLETGADSVGGAIRTLPAKNTLQAKAVAIVLSNFFGAGDSSFRIGSEKIRQVDTVFGGCFKREVFEKIGLFNEKMIRSQDMEFSSRLRKAGGKILLVPEISVSYFPSSTFADFFKHNIVDGIWTTYPLKFGVRFFSWRHLVPLFFVSGLAGLIALSFVSEFFLALLVFSLVLYFLISISVSFLIALKEKNLFLALFLPIAFFIRHFGYGLGSIWGLVKAFF